MANRVPVVHQSELVEGRGECVEIGDKRIALFLVGGEMYAIDDTCTQEGGPLNEGELDATEVECSWHGACFDITTGQCRAPPADADLTAYSVTVEGEQIMVEL